MGTEKNNIRKLTKSEEEKLTYDIATFILGNHDYHFKGKFYPLIGIDTTVPIKTFLKKLRISYADAVSTNLSPDYCNGFTIKDLLVDLINEASGDLEKAQKGAIIIDDVQALAEHGNNLDILKTCITNDIIRLLLDERTVTLDYNNNKYEFDTSKLTVIFTGIIKTEEAAKKINAMFGGRLCKFIHIGNLIKSKKARTSKPINEYTSPVAIDPKEEYKMKLRRIWKEYGC